MGRAPGLPFFPSSQPRRPNLFTPILRAVGQLDDPALLRVLLKSFVISVVCFGVLAGGAYWAIHQWLGPDSLWGLLGGALGSLLALVSALWLFLPVAVIIASLFMAPVCEAVERRWYPGLPPATGANGWAQVWDGLALGLRVLALSVVTLPVSLFFPGVGTALGWVITAWAVGRGLFGAVALRRMTRREVQAAYRAHRLDVLVQGAVLTVAGTLPLVNLLVPVLGPAAMVHVLLRGSPAERPAGWRP